MGLELSSVVPKSFRSNGKIPSHGFSPTTTITPCVIWHFCKAALLRNVSVDLALVAADALDGENASWTCNEDERALKLANWLRTSWS